MPWKKYWEKLFTDLLYKGIQDAAFWNTRFWLVNRGIYPFRYFAVTYNNSLCILDRSFK